MNLRSLGGVMLYFGMNVLLIWFILGRASAEVLPVLLACYFGGVLISLSPIGEKILYLFAGAKPIPRKDMNIKIVPLLENVLYRAKCAMPSMTGAVRLRFVDDPAPLAYALGRRTICVTEGLLRLPDALVIGALAHETAHLAYRHTTVQLLFGGGNLFVTAFIFTIKLALKLCAVISGAAIFRRNSRATGIIMTVFAVVVHGAVSAWTKLSMAFLCLGRRENEFIADAFAYEIGFGNELAAVLDKLHAPQKSSFLSALFSEHPPVHERIGRLQEMGATYRSY